MDVTNNQIARALVGLAIEDTLRDMGIPVFEKVTKTLVTKYKCYIPDCHDHPEYLRETLKQLYGPSHVVIIKNIKKKLEEFTTKKSIERFLEVISE